MAAVSTASGTGLRILLVRGQRVLLDADLAKLYGVTTARLNEQVRRNAVRFPADFMFRLDKEEFAVGGTRKLPLAFTEHGAIMAAAVLNTARAIQTSVYVVRAFVQMRDALANRSDLAKKLNELEKRTELVSSRHDALAAETRSQLKQIIDAIRRLMEPPPSSGARSALSANPRSKLRASAPRSRPR
jgi:hypothetical protein